MNKETYGMHKEDAQRFEACRFDFRLDSKNGLTPSKRKRSDRRNSCYNTLFKCKICGSLFDHRASLLEHKLEHNISKCPICNVKVKNRVTIRQHLQEVHGFGRTSPITIVPTDPHDSVFDDTERHAAGRRLSQPAEQAPFSPPAAGRRLSQPAEEAPFSPPASMAQHFQSLKPRLVSVAVPPPSSGARKQAKPQRIPQQHQTPHHVDDDQEASSDRRVPQPQIQQQQPRYHQSEPVIPVPQLQGHPSGQQAPQGYICINVPIYIGHGQPGGAQAPPMPPQVSGEFHPDSRSFLPPGLQPINPTMMMHVPPPHGGHGGGKGGGPVSCVAPGLVRPPNWQPDSHVIIKEEPPSSDEDKPFTINDLEPGEIRSGAKPAKVMAVGPNNNRRREDHGYPGMPGLQPVPPAGGMRLPVAAESTGYHRKQRVRTQQEDEGILDLTKKCDESMETGEEGERGQEDSCRSTPTLSSGTSTPKPKKKSKFVLDSMVAKLWQNKMSHSDAPGESKEDEERSKPRRTSRAEPHAHYQQQQQPPVESKREAMYRESAPSREAAPSRDARRKGRPMKGDTSVNAMHTAVNSADTGDGLQFTFINDSESGRMNLVGVSKPNPNRGDGLHLTAGSQWTQISNRSNEDFCTQKLDTCKICGQLVEQTELWDHMARKHSDGKRHKCSKCNYIGATRTEVLHHKYMKHGAGAAAGHKESVRATTGTDPSAEPGSDSGKEFMCSACGRGFSTAEDLESHIAEHETPASELIYCEYVGCDGRFLNQQDLWKHVEKLHQKKWTRRQYACPRDKCGRKFINLYHLKRHLAAHKGERQHGCNFPGCSLTFKDARDLHLHKIQHAIKCEMCDYKCQDHKALNWHLKAKHGVVRVGTSGDPEGLTHRMMTRGDQEAPTVVSSDEGSGSETALLPPPPLAPSGPVFPGMASELGMMRSGRGAGGAGTGSPVDLSVKKELCTDDGVIEITPVSPDDGNDGDDDDDDFDDDAEPVMKKIKFASPHDMKSDIIEVQQIPSVNPNDPPFYTSVLKVKPSASRKPRPSEHWTMEQAMGVKFHLCKVCKQMFPSADGMWAHRLVFHDTIETTRCDKCAFSTDSRSELENHALLNHGKDSTTDHEYVCNLCGKEYSSRHGFKNHMLFRHNEGILVEYPCPHDGCDSKLKDRKSLKAHYREAHGEPSTPQHRCPFESCGGSSFSTLALLQGHQVAQHEGQTPGAAVFSCEYPNCDKVFRELKHLKVHAMLHTNEKPMRCGLCEYTCRQRNSMNWHMKSKHNMQKHVTPEGRTTYV